MTRVEPSPGSQILLLLGWVLGWMAVESLVPAAWSPRAPLLALPVWISVVLLGLRLGYGSLFTSLRFAALQLGLLGAALALAAWIPQQVLPGSEALRLLQLWRVHQSLWFLSCVALLAACALQVAWKRRPHTLARLGFLAVHGAPALGLLACLMGRTEGLVKVDPGGSSATLGRVDQPRNLDGSLRSEPLPFVLHLDSFRTEWPEPRFRLYAHRVPDGRGSFLDAPMAFDVKEGDTLRIPPDGIQVQVERMIPDAVEAAIVDDPQAPPEPALRLLLGLGRPQPLVGHLFAQGPASRRDEPGGRFAAVFRESFEPTQLERFRPRPPSSERLVVSSGGRDFSCRVAPGARLEAGGATYHVVRVFPDFEVRPDAAGNPLPRTRSQEPREPWLQVERRLPDGTGRRLLASARSPGLSDALNAPHLPPETTVRYLRDGEEIQRRFVLFTAADHRIRLVEDGRIVQEAAFVLGQPFVVEPGFSVTPVELLSHASPTFTPRPEPARSGRPVLRVTVKGKRLESRWLEARGSDGEPVAAAFLDGGLGLVYRAVEARPKAHHAAIRILEPGGEARTASLCSGDTFRFGAWRVGGPEPSGDGTVLLTVVREPGELPSRIALGMLAAGALWMFLVKPRLKARAGAQP